MKRLIPLLLSLVCGFAQAAGTVPNIFATMPSGNVAASTLDVNFALISNANTFSTYLTDTGGANAYVVAMPAGQTATLAAGLAVQFKASADNTGASTLNVAGTGVKNIINFDGTALVAGQIKQDGIVAVIYDGASYQLLAGGSLAASASTATQLTTGRTIGMTGDLTWTSPAFDGTANVTAAGTLATANTNVGTFGSSTAIPTITADGKGRITAISDNVVIAPAGTLTGDLVVGSFNSGTGASSTTYWRGDMVWATPGGAGAPGGANTNIQINDAGAFYGDAGLVYAKASGSVAMGVANTGTTQLSVSNSNAGAGANVRLAMGTTAGAFILQIPSSAAATAAFMAGPSGAGLDIYTVGANALGLGVNSTPTAIVINAAGTLTTIGNTLAMGANNITSTGSLGATGARLTKGWFADLEVTNAIVGGITGNAVTATTATNIAGGAGGSIPYQSAAATTALLANGTAGYVLTSQGTTLAPVWSAAGTGTVTHTLGNLISGNFVLGNGVADAKDAGWAIVPVVNGGTGVTTSTGTGAVVLNTSPTFTTTAGIGSSGTRSNPGDGILFKSYGAGNSYWLLNAATNFNSAVYFGDPASNTVGGIEYLHNGDILNLRVNSATALSIGSTGAVTIPGTLGVTGNLTNSTLLASKPVFTDGSKVLTSTGTVPVANGGTGLTTIANAAVLVTNSANTLTALTAGANQSVRRNTGNTAWEAYTSPWTYTNVPATASRHEHNITANLDPATDAVHIGDQSFGPLVIPGTAQLTAISRWGIQAIVGTSTTGGLSNTYIGAIPADALMSTSAAYLLTDHDSTQGGQNIGSWGAYIEARGSAGLTSTVGVTWGIELTTQNLSGTASIPIPSNYYPGGRNISGMLIEAAGSSIGATTYNSSAAVVIGANLTFDGATTAGSFVVGDSYQIVTAGTTNFTLLGAANSNVGTKFTATGVGTGTGTASRIVEFNKGILFLDYSLATNNGNMEAIAMSANHQLTWTALGATTPVGRLSSDGTHLTWASNGTTPKVKAPQFESTIATGTAPLVIASTTKVANLQSNLTWGVGSHAGNTDTTDPANNNVFLYWNTGTNNLEIWVDNTRVVNLHYPGAGSPSTLVNN